MRVKFYNGTVETDSPQLRNITKVITGDLIQIYGSSDRLLGFDNLNEYGWDHYIDRGVEKDPLDFLPDDFKRDVIGDRMYDIENFRRTLIPTLSNDKEEKESKVKYFGSISGKKQKLFIFGCPELIPEAVLYEGDEKKAVLTFEGDEVKAKKLIWIVFTFGGESLVSDINLSFRVWEYLPEPGRNVGKYLTSLSIAETEKDTVEKLFGNYWFDRGSDTLVGNKVLDINSTPIYNELMKEAKKKSIWDVDVNYPKNSKITYGEHYVYHSGQELPYNVSNWNEDRKYIKGDLCKKGTNYYEALSASVGVDPSLIASRDVWEELTDIRKQPTEYLSLVDNNRGNNPVLSGKWVKVNYLQKVIKDRGIVNLVAYNSGGTITDKIPGIADHSTFIYPTKDLQIVIIVEPGFIYNDYTEEENYRMYRYEGRRLGLSLSNPNKQVDLNFTEYICQVKLGEVTEEIRLGTEKTITIPLTPDVIGVKELTLTRKAGSTIETVNISDYSVKDGNVLIPFSADYPCSYEYSIEWNYAYSEISLTSYSGFFADKRVGKIIPIHHPQATFSLIPLDRRKHDIKITLGENSSVTLGMEEGKREGWETYIKKGFDTGQGFIEFGIQGEWKGFYTLIVTGSDEDRQLKIEIV